MCVYMCYSYKYIHIPRYTCNTLFLGITAPKPVAMAMASTCFMLSNMFDPNTESETGWESDIRDDVLEECNVYGPVLHIQVDAFSQVHTCTCLILLHYYTYINI